MGFSRIKELKDRGIFIPTSSKSLGPQLWSLWNLATNAQRRAFCDRVGLMVIPGCEGDAFRRNGERSDVGRGKRRAKAATRSPSVDGVS